MALIAHGGPRRITAFLDFVLRPRAVVATPQDAQSPHHYPPRRDRVIESAAMAREMYRL